MPAIKFNENGKLKICQMTDIHLEADGDLIKYEKTLRLIREILANVDPDLVILTGDLAWGQKSAEALVDMAKIFEENGVAWAPVLGNHDGNACDSEIKTREAFADKLLGYEHSLFELGEENVDGNGNYIIDVQTANTETKWSLYLLDSHQGDFYPSQLQWYRKTSAERPKNHSELAFFHVPIPEYTEVWLYEKCMGFNQERVCATHYNDGLFSNFIRGEKMKGIFVGHDHINDFEGTLHGIRLCYGRATGYQCYGLEGFPLGARIIEIDENNTRDFETSIYLEGGEIYKQKFERKPLLTRK